MSMEACDPCAKSETWEPTPAESPAHLDDARPWMSTSPAWVWPGDGRLSDHADQGAGRENPADPAFESKVAARHAAPGALLRTRRRPRRRCQRRRHARQGIRAHFSESQAGRNPHGGRGDAGAGALSARSPSAPAGVRACFVRRCHLRRWSATVRREGLTPSNCRGRPGFLHKHGGLVLSIGQFNQWVASQLMSSGLVQIWPGTPVEGPLFANRTVMGLRWPTREWTRHGAPADGYHARHGCARAPDGRGRWPGRRGRPGDRSNGSACPKATRAATGPWA